jgi:hypothetical protein
MNRRHFFKSITAGGLTVAGTGTLINCSTSTESNNNNQGLADVNITQSGADFEAMGIQTYIAAANSSLLTDQAVIDTALAIKSHHEGHLAELNKLLRDFGQSEVNPANASPDPGVANVTNQTDILELALNVEFQAASFYFSGIVNQVTDASVRKVFANIMPVEVAHMVTYKNVLGRTPAIDGSIFELLTVGS